MVRDASLPSAGLVLVRVALGATLALHGLRDAGPDGARVRALVEAALERLPGLAALWGESVLLYNPDAIAFLWRAAALALGLLLLFGALTRPAGWIVALFLAHGWLYGPPEHAPAFALAALCAVGCAVSSAGRSLGSDALLDAHAPGWLTWRRGTRGRRFLD